MKSAIERLDDWEALCDWLEERPYNASYDPHCKGAYLLTGFYTVYKTVRVPDPDATPRILGGHTVQPQKEIPNPNLEKEKEIARTCREIVKERRRLQLVYWASGFGWRLRKDYKEKIAAERERLRAALFVAPPSEG